MKFFVYFTNPFQYISDNNYIDMNTIFNLKTVYIDDGLCVETSYHKCLTSFRFSNFILGLCGWSLQLKKCCPIPSQSIVYLGYNLDSLSMKISLPPHKLQKTMFLIQEAINFGEAEKPVACRALAQVTGHLAHATVSHGNFVKVVSRKFYL